MNFHCLLFDLDGTLVDSRADLALAINLTLAELGRAALPDSAVVSFIGEGARLLVERALRATQADAPTEATIDEALALFRRHYRAHLLDRTRLYPGVAAALDYFSFLPKAIVTNKPYEHTVALLEGLNLAQHFQIILGGDSLPERKPSPLMLLAAARACEVEPANCLMIGDSRIDILAGQNAGMRTCGFTGGFRGREELAAAGADLLLEDFAELRALVA